MKRIINSKGFSKFEFIIGMLTVLVLMAFGVKAFFDNKKGGDFGAFKKIAENFVKDVSYYKDENLREDGMYYLFYLKDNGFESIINNPFGSGSCDEYESYVNILSPKKVSLKCDNYLIEGTYQEKYTVYEVSDWQIEEEAGDAEIMYTYKKDGREIPDEHMLEAPFIEFFNDTEGTSFKTVEEIFHNKKENIEIISKLYYRDKKIVKEYKN